VTVAVEIASSPLWVSNPRRCRREAEQTIENGVDREPPRSVASVGEAALPFAAGENECPP